MVNIHRDEVTQPASISDAICGLCKFKNLLNLNFTDKIMMIMMIMLTEPEANNCFSTIFRGKYHELQNNGLKHENTDAIMRVHARMKPV